MINHNCNNLLIFANFIIFSMKFIKFYYMLLTYLTILFKSLKKIELDFLFFFSKVVSNVRIAIFLKLFDVVLNLQL